MSRDVNPPRPPTPPRPKPWWAEKLLSALETVTGSRAAISHAGRLQSSRYFVWEETDRRDWSANNRHGETAVVGALDLYTNVEFDPWAEAVGPALDEAEIAWEYTGTSWEPNTGLWHHSWEWTVG